MGGVRVGVEVETVEIAAVVKHADYHDVGKAICRGKEDCVLAGQD